MSPTSVWVVKVEQFRARTTLVPATGCWIWTGATSQSGWRGVFYPCARLAGRVWRVNRFMLMMKTGPLDLPQRDWETGLEYLDRLMDWYRGRESSHTCHNARCINPDHLEWKSHRANVQDQAAERRQAVA